MEAERLQIGYGGRFMDTEFIYDDFEALSDTEFIELETEADRLMSMWEIQNLRAQLMLFHDDQHIGEKRRELMAVHHPDFDEKGLREFEAKPVVDNLEGNMLIHPAATPVIEINKTHTVARGLWWSFGMEALSKCREHPMAIISLGMMPTICVRDGKGEWKLFLRGWQRITKADLHKGWVEDMQTTNCRPPLTKEQDRKAAGKFAYGRNRIRKPVPEPPGKDTFEKYPGDLEEGWLYVNLDEEEAVCWSIV